jgi:putative cardiolipin synthase
MQKTGPYLLRARFLLPLLLAMAAVLHAQSIDDWARSGCDDCMARMQAQTGVYILEKGEEALIGRAWLAKHATKSIDVQYFIWSTDNIGVLAAEQLLTAAERGVSVRVLVDDFIIDAEDRTLLLLSAHPNVQIRIYNPKFVVGVGLWGKLKNSITQFRAVNQRMHDKTAIFDSVAGITGGRNMADEYFDFDHEYNFRDREVLLLGSAVRDMQGNFNEFWNSEFAIPVEQILKDELNDISSEDVTRRSEELHTYAADPANFAPEIRQAIDMTPRYFPALMQAMVWDEVQFISDVPGKNDGSSGLSGGGESTQHLIDAVRRAKKSILIQSPYLVMPDGGIALFEQLIRQGVRIRISTNSLASTDNIPAFAGYASQRGDLLTAGIEIYEFKPSPAIQQQLIERYPRIAGGNPVFAIHAKSMVIDEQISFIGTFNLDPRSSNLNTEVGVLIENSEIARQLSDSIERDILPENSWHTTSDFNPDAEVGFGKRLHVWIDRLLPIEPVL